MTDNATILLCGAFVLLAACRADGQGDGLALFVGRDVCQACHCQGRSAHLCSVDPIPEHDDAFAALAGAKAKHIARICGVAEPPQQSRVCLGCHAAAADEGSRWRRPSFDIAHSVQCEACHGPGSLHAVAAEQRAGRDPGEFSVSVPSNAPELQPVDRTLCDTCHMDKPSHRAVLQEGYRVSPVDDLYKTPVNLTVSPDGMRLYVVCQQANSLVVADTEARRVVAEIDVGRRPHGVTVSPTGRIVYVSNRFDDSVSIIDAQSLRRVADVHVGSDPHGLCTDVAGRRLFVANTGEDSISVIDTDERKEIKRLAAGRGPWSIALEPGGENALVTNVRPNPAPFQHPFESEITVVNTRTETVSARPTVADANMLQGIAFVPGRGFAVCTLVRTKNLVPITRLAQGWTMTNGLGLLWTSDELPHDAIPLGHVDQVLLDAPNDSFPDPMDVAVTPDGRFALVTSGGADQVAVVAVGEVSAAVTNASEAERKDVLPNHLGMSHKWVRKRIAVGRNPQGIAIDRQGRFAYVANAADDSVSIINIAEMEVVGEIDLGGPRFISQIREGQRIFHSAEATFARQFSCRSCHPDGHINGLSFDIEADGIGMSPVDNRTLRGILDTPPFKWEGLNPTLHRQCGPRLAVFFTRLDPYTPGQLEALVRYITTIERPPNRHRDASGLTLAQRRGKAVFERTTNNDGTTIPIPQRCTTCHNTPYRTNRSRQVVGTTMWYDTAADVEFQPPYDTGEFGELGIFYFADTGTSTTPFDVPHLNNIYNGPPYLHNGSAATLEEIWTRFNMTERHGFTGDLTRRQFNDLIAYLKAL